MHESYTSRTCRNWLAPFAEVVCLHLPVESSIFDHGVTQSEIWYDCNEITNDICPYDR